MLREGSVPSPHGRSRGLTVEMSEHLQNTAELAYASIVL